MKSLKSNIPEKFKEQLSPWRQSLAGALHRDRAKPHSQYIQLATVNESGKPENRTLVFRGFIDASNIFTMVTDGRSSKLTASKSIADENWGGALVQPAAIAWYLTESREQYRFSGALVAIDENNKSDEFLEVRKELWERLSAASQEPFWGPKPGESLSAESEEHKHTGSSTSSIPAAFVALLFSADTCDHLLLRPKPQQRVKYWRENGNWCQASINP